MNEDRESTLSLYKQPPLINSEKDNINKKSKSTAGATIREREERSPWPTQVDRQIKFYIKDNFRQNYCLENKIDLA